MAMRIKPCTEFVAFRTDKDMMNELKRLAKKNNCTVSVIIRKLLYCILVDMEQGDDNADK